MSDFTFKHSHGDDRVKWMGFPCQGHHGRCSISIQPQKNASGASWDWDGNREKPTITPSINCHTCGWHGWITKGEFIKA